jgi:hypothetical protein
MQTATARPLTPGVHKGVITAAEVGVFEWRATPENPRGVAIKTQVEVAAAGGVARLDDACDLHNVGRWNAIFRAAGVRVPHGADPAEYLDALIGCEVEIATRNLVVQRGRNAGMTRAVVSKWLAPLER